MREKSSASPAHMPEGLATQLLPWHQLPAHPAHRALRPGRGQRQSPASHEQCQTNWFDEMQTCAEPWGEGQRSCMMVVQQPKCHDMHTGRKYMVWPLSKPRAAH